MLTIIADNTMTSGTITDRQDMPVVTASTILRGIERLAVRVLRVVVPVGAVGAHAYCAPAAASCPSFAMSKHWQLGLGGKKPLGSGQPVGSGNLSLRNQIAG